MKQQSLLIALVTILSVLVLLSSVSADTSNNVNASKPAVPVKNLKSKSSSGWVVTRDIIKLSLNEVDYTRTFVNLIPQLQSKQQTEGSRIHQCVAGLNDCLNEIHRTLHDMKILRPSQDMYEHTMSLKTMVSRVLRFNEDCQPVKRDVDDTVGMMLDRKLVDTGFLINNVIALVSESHS